MALFDYVRDPGEIYRRSFAIIRSEVDLTRFAGLSQEVALRVIHACGMTDIAGKLSASPGAAEAGRAALADGRPVLVDAPMVAQGIVRCRLPAGNPVVCYLDDRRAVELAAAQGTTRSGAAMSLMGDHLEGAVVAIGNAPTALFRLLEMIADGAPRPAVILGFPVGFVGAAEAKNALIASSLPHICLAGRQGGSAMAAAAVNALAKDAP
jgi:precorrin-8X/cobalt-precorrin-8 methylmutase